MFLVNPEMVDINIGTAGLVALTGYLAVSYTHLDRGCGADLG